MNTTICPHGRQLSVCAICAPEADARYENMKRVELYNDMALTIAYVQALNAERANRWHNGDFTNWSALEWCGALCGEAGELANVAKKIRRVETDAAGNAWSDRPLDVDALNAQFASECADVFLYLTLCASRRGINLATAVREKFNAKSEQMGFPERL